MGVTGMSRALLALAIGWAAVGCNSLLGIHELTESNGPDASLDGGTAISTEGGGARDGSAAEGGSPCVPGVSCVPPNPCHRGEVVCSSAGVSTCREMTALQDNGTTCDEQSVCRDGVCSACAEGTSCAVSGKPCRTGTIDCSTGMAQCMESDNAQNGSVCGTGVVCQEGECVPCVSGHSCTPANRCHVGSLDCSQEDAVCTDQTTNLAPGSTCGKG